jgi:hypothetical protein
MRLCAALRLDLVDTHQDALVRVRSRLLRLKAEIVVVVINAEILGISDGDDARAVDFARSAEHPGHTHGSHKSVRRGVKHERIDG